MFKPTPSFAGHRHLAASIYRQPHRSATVIATWEDNPRQNVEKVVEAVAEFVAGGRIPAASVVVRVAGREVFHHSVGLATPTQPVESDQIYDLASVTKVVVGASVTAALLDKGLLSLDTQVVKYLDDVDPRLHVHHLLTHSGGYPAWRPLYSLVSNWGSADSRREVLRLARQTPLEFPPGQRHVYSDLGYITLLQVLEAAGNAPIEHLFETHVRAGTDFYWGHPRAAATEICPVRQRTVIGEVHDLNCLSMGGHSTHAGLFSHARALAQWGELQVQLALSDPERGIARLWALRGAGSHRGGWDGITPGASSTGRSFPPDSVGHLGYTGTSVWLAPSKETVVVLLTNRSFPTDEKGAIREMRPKVHDAIAEELGWMNSFAV